MSDSNSFSLLITYSIKGVTHTYIKPDNNLIKDDILVIELFINNKMKPSRYRVTASSVWMRLIQFELALAQPPATDHFLLTWLYQ